MITGFHTIWCQTSDMDRSVDFYQNVLGLTPGHVSPYWTDFAVGSGRLALHPALEGAPSPLGAYKQGWFIGIQTTDILELRRKLEAANTTIHGDWHDTPSGVVLDFSDPDGNVLEAIQPGAKVSDLG
jgi:predicted enzyme related to lactoylglutathione lyase